MNFNYDKVKKRVEEENHWSTYSDMFMVLSLVFLFLYVITASRVGTINTQVVKKDEETKKLSEKTQQQINDLKQKLTQTEQRLKEYQTITLDYVDKEASDREKQEYDKLLTKMQDLTAQQQDKGKQIRKKIKDLHQRLQETLSKEKDINQYQNTLKHIISKNAVLKSTVLDKDHNLKISQFSLEESRKKITNNIGKINKLTAELQSEKLLKQKRIKQWNSEKSLYKKRISQIKNNYNEKIVSLEQKNKINELKLTDKIQNINKSFAQVKASLNRNKRNLHKTQKQLQFEKEITSKLKKEYQQQITTAKARYAKKNKEIQSLKQTYLQEKKGLISQKLKEQNKAKESYRRKMASIDQSYAQKIEQIKSEMGQMEKSYLDKLSKASPITAERMKIAKAMGGAFNTNGISASVNRESGDVIIDFGLSYFDTDKWYLKKGMKKKIKKLIPLYAKTLFEASDKVSSVEIIGFSSPTYKGRFVDPHSINEKYREAINYNLDLSYKRARSIFSYIFNKKYMNFEYQKKLLPYVKVSGRSYFSEEVRFKPKKGKRRLPSTAECEKYGCLSSQKVIIKYYLKE
ncbi:MAG: hypothetical protein ACO20H_13270 [Bacteriovoracaceae bacterium]